MTRDGQRFDRRCALVTGAGSGIGRATATRLAQEGARVVAVDVDGDAAARTIASLVDPEYGFAVAADCADEDSIAAAVASAVAWSDGLDIVVANAGIELLGQDAPVDRLDLATWHRLLRNNLDGQFLTCKHTLPHLVSAGGGAIVCIGSNCAYLGVARGEPGYSASKGGIMALMRVMAADYIGAGVRVNMVVPGLIDTPMNASTFADPDDTDYWLRQLPIGRAGTAEEVAAAVAWLASDDASYCVGTALVVDGGQSAI